MRIVGPTTLTQQAFSLARLTAAEGVKPGLVYWLVNDPSAVPVAAELLRAFGSHDLMVHQLDVHETTAAADLEWFLAHQKGIAVASVDGFKQLAQAVSLVSANRLIYRVGQNLNPVQVKQSLARLGYGNEESAYAVFSKGATVFIKHPRAVWRITFSEDGIESILDEQAQKNVTVISCPPATLDLTEIPVKDIVLPPGVILLDELLENDIRKRLPPSYHGWISWRFAPFTREGDTSQPLIFSAAPSYSKQFEKLRKDIAAWSKQKYNVELFALDLGVMQTALEQVGLQPKELAWREQRVAMEGFICPAQKTVVLTHAELFGRRKTAKKAKRRDDTAFITTLQINDYVVHEDHGVGRYLGLVTSTIEGHQRENLLIEYAKGDRLYVPVELAYKVDRYVGQAKPVMQRLSGTSWIRLTRQATHDSQAFAKDLLMLYAKRSLIRVEPWHIDLTADQRLHDSFGYQETPDQEQAIKDTYEGLTRDEPIDMLVVGDVGFGKTEVAIRAAYQAFLNHKQVVILCPTTLLAQQHYDTFSERLKPLGLNVEMLSRFTGHIGNSKTSAKDIVAAIKAGGVNVVIGTHRLLSKDVAFDRLGLIIIDEEQRFGVRHKERLKSLRTQAHVLTLSATPIPRTLYFSLSGLRDIATIQTPPQGRQEIETSIEPLNNNRIKEVISKEIARGGQVFYLHNHVQTIYATKRRLQELLGQRVRLGIVHGQMPEDEMSRVVEAFDHGQIDVLICTTIIENGLDMPNVNTLVVENATSYGLGQLYQIRGRIGRGKARAYAYFFHPEAGLSVLAARRLQILQEAKTLGSGFQLAMRDLEMRGMGQLVGKRQHGHIQHVGLSLYGRLLRQAVEELESGHLQPARHEVSINVPVDYGIPEKLIPNPETRSRLYRQISQMDNEADIDRLLSPWHKEIIQLSPDDRQKIENLRNLVLLRQAVLTTPIIAIDYQEPARYEITFERLTSQHVDALTPLAPTMKVQGKSLIIPADEVTDHIAYIRTLLYALSAL